MELGGEFCSSLLSLNIFPVPTIICILLGLNVIPLLKKTVESFCSQYYGIFSVRFVGWDSSILCSSYSLCQCEDGLT